MTWRNKSRTDTPSVGKKEYHLLEPGLYMQLLHGYPNEDAREVAAEDGETGEDGPIIGPLLWIESCYAAYIHLEFAPTARPALYQSLFAKPADKRNTLTLHFLSFVLGGESRNLVLYGGMQYGRWEIFYIDENGKIPGQP